MLARQRSEGVRSAVPALAPFDGPKLYGDSTSAARYSFGRVTLVQADCIEWLRSVHARSIHAVVTDPPYGLMEYSSIEQRKLRNGRGGVWRIPPSFDGHRRSPLPRFTVINGRQLAELRIFFRRWAGALLPALVPGAHVVVASNPLLSYAVADELVSAGFERRGEIIRLVMTMRGGDRPKNAHKEFESVTVMPRSMWEPWLLFRKPIEGRVQDNLRRWKTGGAAAAIGGAAIRGCDSIESDEQARAGDCAAPKPQAAGVSAADRAGGAAVWRGRGA